jgi:hypothetical protein
LALVRFLFSDFPNLPRRLLTALAIALALLHSVLAVSASLHKSPTFDEPAHLTAGYSYWLHQDFRLNPENGNLPQRWSALPLLITHPRFPSLNEGGWKLGSEWLTGQSFFYGDGNDSDWLLLQGRAFIAMFGGALCLLIYFVGRALFGATAGLVAESLAVFSPTMLAHSAVITSDMCAAFFLLASAWTVWRVTFHVTWRRLLAAILTTSAAFLAKASGPLVVPMLAVLVTVRVLDRTELRLLATRVPINTRIGKLFVLLALLLVIGAFVVASIWASFCFRFSAFKSDDLMNRRIDQGWEHVMEKPDVATSVLGLTRHYRLLPDAYLFGLAYVYKSSLGRPAFLDGHWSRLGMPLFFPKSFLYKTTVPVLLLFLAGIFYLLFGYSGKAGPSGGRILENLYRSAPLWSLGLVYGLVAWHSPLNIGERHLLPIYPVIFIMGAGCVPFLKRTRLGCAGLILLLGWHGVASFDARPDYLAYFNPVAGGSKAGFHHLVDSSLDWGQDLPALREWLRANVRPKEATYLSYFGVGDPKWYRLDALTLPGIPYRGPELRALPAAGFYCVSATILQQVYGKTQGPWCAQYELEYQRAMAQLVAAQKIADRSEREHELLKQRTSFDQLMIGRLCAALRRREPVAQAGHSILIYQLSNDEITSALAGPPVELYPSVQVKGHL